MCISNLRIEGGNALKSAGSPFLPALLPRFLAALFVLFLIGVFGLASIFGVAILGPALSHGENVNHAAGQITMLGPGKNFVLLTATGQKMSFQCGNECHASLAHLQRHKNERAHTDVYYIEGPNHTLMALDVD
jgi:hypothetical protein